MKFRPAPPGLLWAPTVFEVVNAGGGVELRFTTDRDLAKDRDDLALLGLNHPWVQAALHQWQQLSPEEVGVAVQADDSPSGILTWWAAHVHGAHGEAWTHVLSLAVDADGQRLPMLERQADALLRGQPADPVLGVPDRQALLEQHLEPMLSRELQYRGLLPEGSSYGARLVGWVEVISSASSGRGKRASQTFAAA